MKTLLIFILLSLNVFALDLLKPISGFWGVGMGYLDTNYKDEDPKVSLAPYIFGTYGDVNFEGNRATYTLWGNGKVYTSIVGQVRTHQSSEKYNKANAFELGADVGFILPKGFITRLAFLHDSSGTHNGYELDYQIFRHDRLESFSLLSSLALQYQSKELTNYYYGTATYTPDTSVVTELEFIATIPIDKFDFFIGIRSYFYSQSINSSPIASSNNTTFVFSGLGYSF